MPQDMASLGLPKAQLIRILKKVPTFYGLLDREYETLISVCGVCVYPEGEKIFSEGEAGRAMYVLLAGEVAVCAEHGGLLQQILPGEIFGEIAMVSELRRTATATATKQALLLSIDRDDPDRLLGRMPRVSYVLMRKIALALAGRLATTNKRIGHGPDEAAPPDPER